MTTQDFLFLHSSHHCIDMKVFMCTDVEKPVKKRGHWWESNSYSTTETFGKWVKCWSWQSGSHRIKVPTCDWSRQQHLAARSWVKLLSVCLCLVWSANPAFIWFHNRDVFPETTLTIIAIRQKASFGAFVFNRWHSLSDKGQAANLFSGLFFQFLG